MKSVKADCVCVFNAVLFAFAWLAKSPVTPQGGGGCCRYSGWQLAAVLIRPIMQKDDCGRKRRGNKGGIQNSCWRGGDCLLSPKLKKLE